MKFVMLFLPLLVLFACGNNRSSQEMMPAPQTAFEKDTQIKEPLYIISAHDSFFAKTYREDGPPPPPFLDEGHYNFIVDHSGGIYFCKAEMLLDNCTPDDSATLGWMAFDSSRFLPMSYRQLKAFLQQEPKGWNKDRVTLIMNDGDTVMPGPVYELLDVLKADRRSQYAVRKTVRGERTILAAKNRHRH